MKKLKVVFFLLNPLPSPDAAWTRIEFLASYLKNVDIRFDVQVIGAFSLKTLDQAGSTKSNALVVHNFIPVIIMTNILSQLFNLISPLILSFFLFLKIRPKLVVISVPSGGNVLGCYLMAKLFRSKIVTDYRDEWEDYILHFGRGKVYRNFISYIKKMMTKYYRSSHAVLAVTEPLVISLKKRGIQDVKLIPNGADLTIFKPKNRIEVRKKIGIPEGAFVIAYSGHIGAYYRVDLLIHALRRLVEGNNCKNIRLIMAGQGQGLHSVLKIKDEIGLSNKVSYFGKIMSKEQLADILNTADIGVIPYDSNPLWRNSLPVKSLEYLACGLPLIATVYDDSLLGKIITQKKLGLVVRPEDAVSLSEAIKIMQDNESLRTNASRNGLSVVSQNFDRHRIASEFYRIVSRCIDNE